MNFYLAEDKKSRKCVCGYENDFAAKFCSKCGAELKEPEQEEVSNKFCNQCGNKISKEDAYCNKCGNKVTECEYQDEKNETTKKDLFANTTEQNCSNRNIKLALKILSFSILICFLLPFVTESAFGFNMSMNGVEATFGTFFSKNMREMCNSEKLPFNIFAFISLASCIISLLYVCQSGEIVKSVAGFNITSATCLIIYMLSYKMYYDYGETLVSIKYGFGLWAIIIINIINAVITLKIGEPEQEKKVPQIKEQEI